MTVLGFDTATAATAVALRRSDGETLEARDDPLEGAHPGHATRLLAMADQLLVEAAVGWANLERLAVGVGPGTFTGLRVGVASARGLAQSLGIELVAVSSLRGLAMAAQQEAGSEGPVLAVIDARRGEVFAAAYGAGLLEQAAPRALAPAAIAELLREAELDGDPEILTVGDGARRYRPELERLGLAVAEEDSPLHRVRAGAICALASDQPAGGDYGPVLPDYRRRPDAELALADGAARRGAGL